MNNLDKYGPLLDRLLNPSIEFDDIDLSGIPPEDVLFLLQAVRAWALMAHGRANELGGTLATIESFASRREDVPIIVVGKDSGYIH